MEIDYLPLSSRQRRIVLDMFEETNSEECMFDGYRQAYVRKESLQDRLQNMQGQPFPLGETFTILTQLGQALAYAHECDVTHGNLKPHNILFNDKGDILLADFFLHALATQPDNATEPETSAYRAPELLPGCASKQGDQYALGCIAYEMLTGQPPFLVPSVSKPGTFFRTKTAIPPKHFNPALSSLCEEAILKAMAKEPTERHSNISSFLIALGIPIDARDQAALRGTVPLPLLSSPAEQAHPLQAPVEDVIEEAEVLDTSTSMDVSETHALADSIFYTRDDDPFEGSLVADTIPTNPNATIYASGHAEPLSIGSTRRFFKWKPLGVVLTGLVVVCIFATSFLLLSTLFSTQGANTMPIRDTTIDMPSPTPADTPPTYLTTPSPSNPMPGVTTAPEQGSTVVPSPTATPIPTIEPTPTPTPKHGHSH